MNVIKMRLNPSCITKIPLDIINDDFTFIVNGSKIKTKKLIAYLLSPTLCKNHISDQTIDTFVIQTENDGNFSHILNLSKFTEISFPEREAPFISEVIKNLGNTFIDFTDPKESIEITTSNVISLIKQHEKSDIFYSKKLSKEIDYISSNFYRICEGNAEELNGISLDTFYKILNNDKFKLTKEDQLLELINKLKQHDEKYSILYEYVLFENVTSKKIHDFLQTFDKEDLTEGIWRQLKKRLEKDVESEVNYQRYAGILRNLIY